MSERSGKVTISEAQAPIYVATFEGTPTEAQFEEYLRHLSKITQRPEVKALVFDATRNGATPPSQRRRMADWMQEFDEAIRTKTAGCAFVLPSALQRGVLTAILWLQPMACPHTIVPTLEEAVTWAKNKLHTSPLTGRKSA